MPTHPRTRSAIASGDHVANQLRGRFNSVFFRLVDRYVHHKIGPRKEELFADLPDRVVELGPGVGTNLRYYRPGTELVAIEPNRYMHPALAQAAARRGVSLEVRTVGAEATGLPADSVDAVVSTLVLCTVPDVPDALAEVRRILRPGGRMLLIEHVNAPHGSILARVQRMLRRPWLWVFEGCDLCRETAITLEFAGFASIELETYRLRSVFYPVNHQIAGVFTA